MKTVLQLLAVALACFAEAALACQITPIEAVFRAVFRGPMWFSGLAANSGSGKQWAGYTALNSGTASVTISTAVVNSDSMININFKAAGTLAASGFPTALVANSIVSGVSFAIAQADGAGRAPSGTVMWDIRRTS